LGSVYELARQSLAASRVLSLQFDSDGDIRGHGRHGSSETLQILAGSMLCARIAWLRLGFDDGSRYGELLLGHHRNPDWRRLQILWRHAL
jgi:hypothetical protein